MFGISERKEYKILMTIRARYKKYWVVWLSRHECSLFWLSERKMYEIINYLRDNWMFRWLKRVKCSSWLHSCHIYWITERLQTILSELKEVKFEYKIYTPDDVLSYVSQFAKIKYRQWKFSIQWIYYTVASEWKWRWKIYDTQNNRIISLITIQNLRWI